MRARLENWLLRHWYSNRQPPWYLRLLEPLYRAAYQRNQKHKQAGGGVYHSNLPLIVVGNITAGGSGKTPLVIRLCQLAIDGNLKPGIASTGYGRQGKDTLIVDAHSDTLRCGDEPVLLAQRTGVPVVVAAYRPDAVKKLNEMDLDLIFSDDGLQQVDLGRAMDICVVDGARGLGNGHLIPAGPLRESAARLAQVDHVISNGEWPDKPGDVNVNIMNLQANVVRSLDDATEFPVDDFRQRCTGTQLHAVAGIGNPQRFFRMLEALDFKAGSQGYSDHHQFTREDFTSIKAGTTIIMTEKDAVKCRSLGLENAWYVPVETHLPDKFEQVFKQQLLTLVKNK